MVSHRVSKRRELTSYSRIKYLIRIKEIVERRNGEPIKFLFLPKMGLLGSQACTEKQDRRYSDPKARNG